MFGKVATFPDVEVAVIGEQPPRLLEELQRLFKVHLVFSEPDTFAALARVGSSIRGAVGNGMSGLTRHHLELMPKIEICAIHGVGLETTDLPAVRERGVVITTAPVLFDDVADLAIALALSCCRQIPKAHRFVREGQWGATRLARAQVHWDARRHCRPGPHRHRARTPARRVQDDDRLFRPRATRRPLSTLSRCAQARREQRHSVSVRGRRPKGSPPIIGREVLEALVRAACSSIFRAAGSSTRKRLVAALVSKASRRGGP